MLRTLLTAAIVLCATLSSARAEAYRLQVVAASELRLDPAVLPGSSTLTIRLHLRDDRGAPLARRPVALTFLPAGAAESSRALRTDENGDGVVRLDVSSSRRVRVRGAFSGDSTAASTRSEIDVDFDAPFVTADLLLPSEGVTLGERAVEAIVTVRVGEVQTVSPARLAVELSHVMDPSGRRRSLAAGATDGAGRVSLVFPTDRFEAPGVARIVPRIDLGRGRVIEGTGRELLVRSRTALSLLREDSDDEREGVTVFGAVLLSSGAPVPEAAVRILRGGSTLGAARADARGQFRVRLGAEALSEPGVRVRAVFEPTEPWFIASESTELELTAPAPPPIHWIWAVGPLGVAALAIGWITLQRKEIALAPALSPPPRGEDHLEHVAIAGSTGVTLRISVVDRATGRRLSRVRLRLDDGPWRDHDDAPLARDEGGGCQVALESEGFAPRVVSLALPPSGEYRVQVAMQTWREALFARLRPHLERARRSPVLPTPRELARSLAEGEGVDELIALIERGCYGPTAPGAGEVRAADELASSTGGAGTSARPEQR